MNMQALDEQCGCKSYARDLSWIVRPTLLFSGCANYVTNCADIFP